ncbi:Leucine rich repeats (6 copies), putative [Entamoeba histolytica]
MQLGYNEIMIVSKYFEDINDFINLEIGIKRFRGNMERFHFNPIPLNEYSRKLFPNIETFHIYNEKDEVFKDGKIFKYVIWYKVNYSRYLEENEETNECKNIEYTKYDREKYGNTIPIEVNSLGDYCFYLCNDIQEINIPTNVSKIGNGCFYGCSSLTTINIPTSVSKIGYSCFEECKSLTSIEIPSTITSFGNGCFYQCGYEEELKKNKIIPEYCFYI